MDLYSSFIIYLILYRIAIILVGLASIYFGYRLFLNGVFGVQKVKGSDFEANIGSNKFYLKNAAPGTLFALFGVILISNMMLSGSPELTRESLQELKTAEINDEKTIVTPQELVTSLPDSILSLKERKSNTSNEISVEEFNQQIEQLRDETQHELVSLKQTVTLRDGENTEKLISIIDNRVEALLNEGGAMSYLYNEKEHIKALDAIAMNINAVAWSNKLKGNTKKALEQAKIAVALSPDEANFLDTLSEIYADLNDYENAVIYMKRATEIDPNKKSRLEALESLLK
ncbi:MAG: hypothetical protein RLO17_07620 [Cyclobacteriaceae bacterium]